MSPGPLAEGLGRGKVWLSGPLGWAPTLVASLRGPLSPREDVARQGHRSHPRGTPLACRPRVRGAGPA